MLKATATIAIIGSFAYGAIDLGSTMPTGPAIPQRAHKGDRLPIAPARSQNAGSHHESNCDRSQTPPDSQPRQVRIVNIDPRSANIQVVSFSN